jgi:hypothetical protein
MHYIVTATPDWVIHTRAFRFRGTRKGGGWLPLNKKSQNIICITKEPEALLKLYSRELCSTIDPYKNTKTEYIYSEQFALLAARG